MSGSAKPKRRRAAGAALRYEHVRQRPSAWQQAKEKTSWKDAGSGCLILLVCLVAVAGFAMTEHEWGPELWGRVAPASPGGGYGFAAAVGAVLPLGLAAVIATLSRMKWKASPLRSLGWVAASLPGVAVCVFWALVVAATTRPRYRRNWDSGCYGLGDPCWVHQEYPWVWAVGLLSTVLVAAALIAVLIKVTDARERAGST
ncbi:hypothetical protein ABT040_28725 [Streptomyces sp. NPDC002688]|uniref:hypothetical protein n=1 Tax=Streptomyces sp. NPDC002688 TaxID=3154423 RepID=UPI003331A487